MQYYSSLHEQRGHAQAELMYELNIFQPWHFSANNYIQEV